jgi:hypothetical protein
MASKNGTKPKLTKKKSLIEKDLENQVYIE